MAAYTGSLLVLKTSDKQEAFGLGTERKEARALISTDKSHGGVQSLRVLSGGYYEVLAACDAGSRTFSAWVWPTAGVCRLKLLGLDRTVLADAVSSGNGAWQQLSITYTCVKGNYIIQLSNTAWSSGDVRAWYDDVAVDSA